MCLPDHPACLQLYFHHQHHPTLSWRQYDRSISSAMAFVVLNGFPGVGKLTIARSLGFALLFARPWVVRACSWLLPSDALPNTRVFHNHLFIDAVVALYDRNDPGFHPLRRALVGLCLTPCACT
jgi:hypothetical protein